MLLILGAVALIGCGDGDATDGSEAVAGEQLYPWVKGPSREFIVPGGDNAVQSFGREATPTERKQASLRIHAWMRARAAKDWKRDCSHFSQDYMKRLVEDANRVTDGMVKTCPQALAYFGPAASGNYKNTLDGPIDSLRVKEGQGYAQYHGLENKDYVVAMQKEDGEWWVSHSRPFGRNE